MTEETEGEAFEKLQILLRQLKAFVYDHTNEATTTRADCYRAINELRGEFCRILF